jgi:hypothetical protein
MHACMSFADGVGRAFTRRHDVRAVALPPLRPAAFCAVVPPWDEGLRELDECDAFPPRHDEPGEFAMLAARSFEKVPGEQRIPQRRL